MKISRTIITSLAILLSHSAAVEARENRLLQFAKSAEAEFEKSSTYPCLNNYPCFQISLDYPESIDLSKPLPWEDIDFKSNPEAYMDSVRVYAGEGNLEVDWDVSKNVLRGWFHAPWMHQGRRGREPVRGLTLERGSRWHELSPNQVRRTNNWAVGFYNNRGGYEFGRVWKNKAIPDTSSVRFPIGTVSVKLLFTDATNEEAPYLTGSGEGLTWHAQINRGDSPVPLRLLQVDFAVRDARADDATGWVFGTFMFDSSKGNLNYWDNLLPVGLHWGNDTVLTRKMYDSGVKPNEGWVNPSVSKMFSNHRPPFGDLGYLGRMNGPVDSPFSSCLACHGRAVDTSGERGPAFTPELADMCVRKVEIEDNETYEIISGCTVSNEAETRIRVFFRNLKPGEPFLPNTKSLDYSLQMADGIAHWTTWFRKNFSTQFGSAFLSETYSGVQQLSVESSSTTVPSLIVPTLPLDKAFGRGDDDL